MDSRIAKSDNAEARVAEDIVGPKIAEGHKPGKKIAEGGTDVLAVELKTEDQPIGEMDNAVDCGDLVYTEAHASNLARVGGAGHGFGSVRALLPLVSQLQCHGAATGWAAYGAGGQHRAARLCLLHPPD